MKLGISSKKADYIGIMSSLLCLIHCLTTPILLMTSVLMSDNSLQISYLNLDYVFIGVNIIAVYFASRHDTLPVIKTSLWSFLLLFAVSIILEDVNKTFNYLGHIASLGLIALHLVNIRYCRTRHTHGANSYAQPKAREVASTTF